MDEFIFKHRIQQGQAIRNTINQPNTSSIRQEDLSFCSSRLLAAIPLVQQQDATLATVIENILADLAAIQPDDAVKKVKDNLLTYPESAIFFATACHVVAQTMSEFVRDTSPQTINDLRESLANWYQKFQIALENKSHPFDDLELSCLQVFLAQSSIFHDKDAYNWAIDQTFESMDPVRFSSRFLVDLVCVSGGSLDWNKDEGRYIQFLEKLEESRDAFTYVDLVVRLIGGPKLTELSRPQGNQSKKKREKKVLGDNEKNFFVRLIEDTLETVGWALPLIGVIGVGWLCLWGFGQYFSYFENTSHVGQQSLAEWYENAEKMRELQEKEEAEWDAQREAIANGDVINSAEADEISPDLIDDIDIAEEPEPEETEVALAITPEPIEPEITATETPNQTPAPTATNTPSAINANNYSTELEPFYQANIPEEFLFVINNHRQWMVPRFKTSRRNLAGHQMYARHRSTPIVTINPQNTSVAKVHYPITWFSGPKEDKTQFIEAHYERNQIGQWTVLKAARCHPPANSATPNMNQLVYLEESMELAWAEELFTPNPFY